MRDDVALLDIASATVGFVGTMAAHYRDAGVPFLRSLNVKPFQIDYSDLKFLDEDFEATLQKSRLRENDILVVRTGEPGNCCVVPDHLVGANCSDVVIIRPNVDRANPHYLAAYINTVGRKQISNNKVGAIQQHFNVRSAEQLRVNLPSLDVQASIAQLLNALNNAIATNNQVNDNLQAMLQTLYGYWFLQFDFPDENGRPYRSSGGRMVWNDQLKREIPEGWRVVKLRELLRKNRKAFDYKTVEPTIDLSVMPTGSIALNNLSRSDAFSSNLYQMSEGDILFGAIRPYLKKAGIAPCNGVVAGTVHSFSPIRVDDYNFTLATITSEDMFSHAVRSSTGTRMPTVKADDLLNLAVAYSESVAMAFNQIQIARPIIERVKESSRLSELRDWLLPMLMNGQATVANLDKLSFT